VSDTENDRDGLRLENRLVDRAVLRWFALEGVAVEEASPELQRAVSDRCGELRGLFPELAAAADRLAPARKLYRGLGIDPTKHRPSSEALLRRVLKGRGLFEVNTAVDAANLSSLHHHLPVGLYDLGRVVAGPDPVVFRLGAAGESYPGIGKGEINLEGRPALVDRSGPFGNPSADSYRTRITVETSRLLYVLFAPAGTPVEHLAEMESAARDLMLRFVGGR